MAAVGLDGLQSLGTVYGLESGEQDGLYNMALDEALLEWVRMHTEPLLIVRTYRWKQPTWSLGVNQPARELRRLLAASPPQESRPGEPSTAPLAIVRRPTGGRAILHGEDVSYSFVTNAPSLLRLPLAESYCIFATLVRQSLENLGVPVQCDPVANGRAYTRSAVCFETHTPSDLLAATGQKITGSAQLRRAGGVLQHGSAFLRPFEIEEPAFTERLFRAVQQATGRKTLELWSFSADFQARLAALLPLYAEQSREIAESASATSGSHLTPASL